MDNALSKSAKTLLKLFYGMGTLFFLSGLFWFMGNQTFLHGIKALLIVSSIYSIAFFFAGFFLLKKNKKSLAGKSSLFLSIAMVPFITFSIQNLSGIAYSPFLLEKCQFYFWIFESRFLLQLTTILAALSILHFIRVPLLSVMVYTPLWLISLDLISCLLGKASGPFIANTSLTLGAALIVFSVFIERLQKKDNDFAFWGYFTGTVIFFIGLNLYTFTSEIGYAFYAFISFLLLLLAPVLRRIIFIVFGGMGLVTYILDLAYRHFFDSPLFPFLLSAMGAFLMIFPFILKKHNNKVLSFLNRISIKKQL